MKPIINRRIRRSSSHDTPVVKKENQQEQSFFGNATQATFFQPATLIQRKCAGCEKEEKLQRVADKKEDEKKLMKKDDEKLERSAGNKEEERLQKKDAPGSAGGGANVSSYVNSLNGRGNPLPAKTNHFFSKRMGFDFSNVKVHTDREAAESAKAVNAKAYTIGNNIVFNEGEYNEESSAGKKLMAHELAHVIQNPAHKEKIFTKKFISCKDRYRRYSDRVHDKENYNTRLASNIDSWTPYLIDKVRPLVDSMFNTEEEIDWVGKIGGLLLETLIDLTKKSPLIIAGHALKFIIETAKEESAKADKKAIDEQKKMIGDSAIKMLVMLKDTEFAEGKEYITTEFTEMISNSTSPCYQLNKNLYDNIDTRFPRLSEQNFSEVSSIAAELIAKVMFFKKELENFKYTGLLPSESRKKEFEDCKRKYYPEHGMPTQEQENIAGEKCYYLTFSYPYEAEADSMVEKLKTEI